MQALPEKAKARYLHKLQEIGCTVDPYVDSYGNQLSLLPNVKYSHICDFIENHTIEGNDPQKAFKSLDSYHMVCSEGWMGSLSVKKYRNTVLVKCDVKPSQRSGVIYKTWVAVKPDGSVQYGHCTCMAGLSEVCNHVGAVLYKMMHVVASTSELSCTSLPNAWLPATVKKTVSPAPLTDINFKLNKVDKCKSTISTPKKVKLSAKLPNPSFKEPPELSKENFLEKLSHSKHKRAIFSVHEKFNTPYIPLSQQRKMPKTISSLYNEEKVSSKHGELVECARLAIQSYDITEEEINNLEKATQLQSKCKLWSIHRAGRITASNFKSAVRTNPNQPSVSLIKRICYPQQHVFTNSATRWGCEHEATAVDEFFNWFSLDHDDPELLSCGFVISKKFPFLGASPDGIVTCSCHGKYLIEVKCPHRCSNKSLQEAVQESSFYLKDKEGILALDNSHSYYYQVQCQLGVTGMDKGFFIVWTPDKLHIEEIQADQPFFEANVAAANILIEKAILPEIIGCWFSKRRQGDMDDAEEGSSVPSTVNIEDPHSASSTPNTGSDNECITYCYCKGTDDGTKMICCDNDNCASGQWFHYRCVNIKRAPRGKWFCKECCD